MERGRKEGILSPVAELFDLPADIVAGLPHLEMIGSRQLFLERHQGILSYSDALIDINTNRGVLRIRGTGLSLLAMTAEEVRVGGEITAVEWVK
ncbi:MAG: YabP/YqfC family sporulation protein [Oscillibacter sp.]|jgi:sporulation protein YqfC|nr:YabP/YqfC family sporulation protein [Oscillibacter sp.]